VSSELDSIAGIGEKSKKELLTHFKSVKRLRLASNDEIAEIVGSKRASIIYKHFYLLKFVVILIKFYKD
jgi:excinuclease ABC subunit C